MDAQIQDALAKVAEAQKALAEAQAAALAQAAGVAPAAVQTPEPSVPEPAPAGGSQIESFQDGRGSRCGGEIPGRRSGKRRSQAESIKIPRGGSTSFFRGSRCGSPACAAEGVSPAAGAPPAGDGGIQPPAGTESARDMAASVDKSKSLLRGVIYGVCALVVIAAGVGIYAWSTSSKKEKGGR